MFASVSHEFRNPLNAIINSYQLINNRFDSFVDSDGPKDEDLSLMRKFIKMGTNSSLLLLSLIEDILDLSKMQAGTFKMNFTKFTLQNLLSEVLDIFEFQCENKRLKLILDVDEQLLKTMIESDRGRIKQILLNLLSNSIKFTFKGSITIKIKCVRVTRTKFIQFSVIDTGIGIKKEDHHKLFNLFGMISESNKLNPNG